MLAFYEDAGDGAALRTAVEADPRNADAWYRLGCTLAIALDYEGAMQAFLEVVGLDRALREDGGRRALLSLFDLLGADHELTPRYRKRLANALY